MKYKSEYCLNLHELNDFLEKCNKNGYEIITMTERCGYTIIYKKGE